MVLRRTPRLLGSLWGGSAVPPQKVSRCYHNQERADDHHYSGFVPIEYHFLATLIRRHAASTGSSILNLTIMTNTDSVAGSARTILHQTGARRVAHSRAGMTIRNKIIFANASLSSLVMLLPPLCMISGVSHRQSVSPPANLRAISKQSSQITQKRATRSPDRVRPSTPAIPEVSAASPAATVYRSSGAIGTRIQGRLSPPSSPVQTVSLQRQRGSMGPAKDGLAVTGQGPGSPQSSRKPEPHRSICCHSPDPGVPLQGATPSGFSGFVAAETAGRSVPRQSRLYRGRQ